MPKLVDHDQRRRQIAEAVWRLACTTGLEAVTLRQVAAEAGVSMRLVQYYFGTRHALLVKALEILNAANTLAAAERLHGITDPVDLLRGVLTELLPLDERRRITRLVHIAYFVQILHDQAMIDAFAQASPALEQLVAMLLSQARDQEHDLQPERTLRQARGLVAIAEGMADKILLGHLEDNDARSVIEEQLDLLLQRHPFR